MKLLIRASSGKVLGIEVTPEITVGQLKTLILDKESVPVDRQLLVYEGRVLEDSYELSAYNIGNGAWIDFAIQSDEEFISVFCFLADGEERLINVSLDLTETVKSLKIKLEESTQIAISNQVLEFAGMTLDGNRRLVDYGATSGSVLELRCQERPESEIPVRLIGGRTFTVQGWQGMTINDVKVELRNRISAPGISISIRLLSGGVELADSDNPFDFVQKHGYLFLVECGHFSNTSDARVMSASQLKEIVNRVRRITPLRASSYSASFITPSRARFVFLADDISPQEVDVLRQMFEVNDAVAPVVTTTPFMVPVMAAAPRELSVATSQGPPRDFMPAVASLPVRQSQAPPRDFRSTEESLPVISPRQSKGPPRDSRSRVESLPVISPRQSKVPPRDTWSTEEALLISPRQSQRPPLVSALMTASASLPTSNWRWRSQPGSEHWTSNTARIPLMNMRDLPSRSLGGLAADDATRCLLETLPSPAPIKDLLRNKTFIAHLMAGVARNESVAVSLYDSGTQSIGGSDTVAPMQADARTARHDDLQYVSSYARSSGGLDAKDVEILSLHEPDKVWQGCSLPQIFADKEASQLFTEQVRDRIASAGGMESGKDIRMLMVREGSVQFVYTHWHYRHLEEIVEAPFDNGEAERKFQAEFTSFQSTRVHPLRFVMNIDLDSIDCTSPGAYKDFTNEGMTFSVGPTDSTRPYHQPRGWVRMGLKVKGKYEDDKWLEPFQNPNCWYRAYHGTGGPKAFSGIVNEGLRPSSWGKLGEGVYVSPHIDWAEGYAGATTVRFSDGSQLSFLVAFMCAVRPGAIAAEGYPRSQKYPKENSEWTILSGADVRPYGILIKQVQDLDDDLET